MKTAIVFYSMSGNVRWTAERIAELTDGDLIELRCVKEFPDKGFRKFFWSGKSAVMKEKPALQPYEFEADKYDCIILGSPVWAANIAPPLRTFISENAGFLENKVISAFVCMSGSGGEKALEKLSDLISLSKTMILIDLKERENPENEIKIREFCDIK